MTGSQPTPRLTRRLRILRATLAIGFVGGTAFVAAGGTQRADSADMLSGGFGLVTRRFVDSLPTCEVYERAARGLVEELGDPYSELLSPKQLAAFSLSTLGRYGGVGMEVLGVGDSVFVVEVIPGTPSAAAVVARVSTATSMVARSGATSTSP